MSVVLLLMVVGCADRPAEDRSSADGSGGATIAPVPAESSSRRILVLGTSLTAGLGLDPRQAYPALLQAKIDSLGLDYRVVNAGVSGETSAGARRRLDWLLREPVAVLIIETGANDGLRGQPPESLAANLQAIIDRARRQTPAPRLVLAGMEAPPNLGRRYTERFRAVYLDVARANEVTLVPFLLAGVGGVDSLNQADGIHPTAAGQRLVAETVWLALRPLLQAGAGAGVGAGS